MVGKFPEQSLYEGVFYIYIVKQSLYEGAFYIYCNDRNKMQCLFAYNNYLLDTNASVCQNWKLKIYNVDENMHSNTPKKIRILVILRDAPLVCFVRWWHVWSTLLSSLLSLLSESPMIILFAAGLCFKKNSVLFSRWSSILVLFHFVLFSLLL